MLRRLWTLIVMRNREYYRDRSSLTWNLLFPFLIITGFSLTFTRDASTQYKVGIVKPAGSGSMVAAAQEDRQYRAFMNTKFLEFISFSEVDAGLEKLKHHRIDLLIQPARKKYWVSNTSPKGYVVEKLLLAGSSETGNRFSRQSISGREIPYVEWLFPGILGMNIMFSSLFGVGYMVITYRKNGVLKRLSVTPVRTFEFLTAQVLSRMIIIIVSTAIVYTGCAIILGFHNRGSYIPLIASFLLGSFSMISLSLLVACRSSSEEFAGGILNLISWPMMFLSEVWFSLEGANPWVVKFSKIFPLTHMVDSARRIMNDGAGFKEVSLQLTILAVMSAVFITLGSLLFKWRRD